MGVDGDAFAQIFLQVLHAQAVRGEERALQEQVAEASGGIRMMTGARSPRLP